MFVLSPFPHHLGSLISRFGHAIALVTQVGDMGYIFASIPSMVEARQNCCIICGLPSPIIFSNLVNVIFPVLY